LFYGTSGKEASMNRVRREDWLHSTNDKATGNEALRITILRASL
jgi:hypothetical protein